jgi:hypothetical protein
MGLLSRLLAKENFEGIVGGYAWGRKNFVAG